MLTRAEIRVASTTYPDGRPAVQLTVGRANPAEPYGRPLLLTLTYAFASILEGILGSAAA